MDEYWEVRLKKAEVQTEHAEQRLEELYKLVTQLNGQLIQSEKVRMDTLEALEQDIKSLNKKGSIFENQLKLFRQKVAILQAVGRPSDSAPS